MIKYYTLIILGGLLTFSCTKQLDSITPNQASASGSSGSTLDTTKTPQDSTAHIPTDTTHIPPDTTVKTPSIPTSMKIDFLLNCGSQDESFKYEIYDTAWFRIAVLNPSQNIIAVNQDEWACNSIHIPAAYADKSYVPNKTYHFIMRVYGDTISSTGLVCKFSVQTHDFIFQVDTSGKVINLKTQNLTFVEDQFGKQVNDVEVRCDKIIMNSRIPRQDPNFIVEPIQE